MFPHSWLVSHSTETGIWKKHCDSIMQTVQSTDKFVRQISQKSMKRINSYITKQIACTAPPWFSKQNTQTIVVPQQDTHFFSKSWLRFNFPLQGRCSFCGISSGPHCRSLNRLPTVKWIGELAFFWSEWGLTVEWTTGGSGAGGGVKDSRPWQTLFWRYSHVWGII